jgi:hypothetical protein
MNWIRTCVRHRDPPPQAGPPSPRHKRVHVGVEVHPGYSRLANFNKEGRYQLCGPNAFNRYGFTEQVPNRLSSVTPRSPQPARGSHSPTPAASARWSIALYDWARFGSLPRGYSWIARELGEGRVTARALVECTLRYGDRGTIRRIGALLGREGTAPRLLKRLEAAIPATTSTIPWIPGRPKRGTVSRRWGLVLNREG